MGTYPHPYKLTSAYRHLFEVWTFSALTFVSTQPIGAIRYDIYREQRPARVIYSYMILCYQPHYRQR